MRGPHPFSELTEAILSPSTQVRIASFVGGPMSCVEHRPPELMVETVYVSPVGVFSWPSAAPLGVETVTANESMTITIEPRDEPLTSQLFCAVRSTGTFFSDLFPFRFCVPFTN
jgi:hypothetical protein